jgi:hypothetical protein
MSDEQAESIAPVVEEQSSDRNQMALVIAVVALIVATIGLVKPAPRVDGEKERYIAAACGAVIVNLARIAEEQDIAGLTGLAQPMRILRDFPESAEMAEDLIAGVEAASEDETDLEELGDATVAIGKWCGLR